MDLATLTSGVSRRMSVRVCRPEAICGNCIDTTREGRSSVHGKRELSPTVVTFDLTYTRTVRFVMADITRATESICHAPLSMP